MRWRLTPLRHPLAAYALGIFRCLRGQPVAAPTPGGGSGLDESLRWSRRRRARSMDGHGAALVGRALCSRLAVAAPRPSERRRAAARQEIVDDCPSVDDRCCATTRTTSALVSLLVEPSSAALDASPAPRARCCCGEAQPARKRADPRGGFRRGEAQLRRRGATTPKSLQKPSKP